MCARLVASLILVFATTAIGSADEGENQKLDQVLDELRDLKSRITQLEEQVQILSGRQRAALKSLDRQTVREIQIVPQPLESIVPPRVPFEAAEVLRIQFESPGTLLKNIHERERQLRSRHFAPELYPGPWRRTPPTLP